MADISNLRRFAPLPLRLVVGYGFLAHGLAKLERGEAHFVSIVHMLGVPAPGLMAWLTIWGEIACGAMMLIGALVPLIAVPMLAILMVAIFTVHLPFGFTSIKLVDVTAAGPMFGPPGIETDLLYIAAIACLVLCGPGPLTVDNWLEQRLARAGPLPWTLRQREP